MANASYYKLAREEMLKYIPGSVSSLLDVGCSEGNFGASVKKKFSCLVWGIEPEKEPFQKAKEKLDFAINSIFNDSLKFDRQFDVITFNDVLEHIADPWAALIHCKSLLTPQGRIIASIPNILYFHDFIQMLLTKDWKYEEAGIFDRTHLRFFTKKSIERMFRECGYEILQMEGIRPTDSKKYFLFNAITFGFWAESKFLQYAVVAKPLG